MPETLLAGEPLRIGFLLCVREDNGKVYRLRYDKRHEVLGVCTADLKSGDVVPYLADTETIMQALMANEADRA